jgi:hypothetical protein
MTAPNQPKHPEPPAPLSAELQDPRRSRSVSAVYAFIEAEKTARRVALLCQTPKGARFFYAWRAGEGQPYLAA